MNKSIYCLALIGFLQACGGGGGGATSNLPSPSTPTSPVPPPGGGSPGSPTAVNTLATGTIASATAAAPGFFDTPLNPPNTLAPKTITYIGSTGPNTVTYSSDLTFVTAGGRNYSFVQGKDGASFALIGIPNNNAGSFISGASAAPTSNTVVYSGSYFGRHNGAPITVGNPFIQGNANIVADFDGNSFSGSITNRSVVTGSATVNAAAFTADVNFGGSITNTGVMRGTHFDSNSSGTVDAIAFSNGLVGTVNIAHSEGRLPLFPGSTTCGFGASASCTLFETGVFSAE